MEEGKLGGVRRGESRVDLREGNVGAAQLVFVLLLLYCGLHIGSLFLFGFGFGPCRLYFPFRSPCP